MKLDKLIKRLQDMRDLIGYDCPVQILDEEWLYHDIDAVGVFDNEKHILELLPKSMIVVLETNSSMK